MLVSIIIRTLNEDKYLGRLLRSIEEQKINGFYNEIVIVDSGSTDKTLEIAKKYKARVTFIKKNNFTFGRSLNIGCKFAKGDIFVFISGHCIPVNKNWLSYLIEPLVKNKYDYTYGRQIGVETTKFSENQVFDKYFPKVSRIRINEIFCNNANSAIKKDVWSKYKFNEELTGLEDMFLAKQINQDNGKIGYIPESVVYHIHNESWSQIKTRYERESIALQKIMPEVTVSLADTFYFLFTGILKDVRLAISKKVFFKELLSIILFRFMQYYGVYKGNHECRKLSNDAKMKYFYPRLRGYRKK
jgi:rhamnosyltransferase